MAVVGQRHGPSVLLAGEETIPLEQTAGWAPGSPMKGAENLAATRIRSPHPPAHSHLRYLLSYPHNRLLVKYINTVRFGEVH